MCPCHSPCSHSRRTQDSGRLPEEGVESGEQIIMVIKENLNDICSSSPVFVVVGPVVQVQVTLFLILAEGAALDLGDDQCRGPSINAKDHVFG